MNAPDAKSGLDRRQFIQGVTAGAAGLAIAAGTRGARADEEKKPAADVVKRRALGKTGIETSVVIYGCGGASSEHLPLMRAAYERGVNTFDVAWGYGGGRAEEAVGEFLDTVKDRSKVHVITKTTGFRPPRGGAKAVYAALKEELTKSLQRLRTEYVDVLYCPHGATDPAQFADKALEDALGQLKEEKLVRHLGASSHTNYRLVGETAVSKSWCEVFMPVANICTQNPDAEGGVPGPRRGGRGRAVEDMRAVLEAAAKNKVGLVAMKVANDGYLSDSADALLVKAFPKDSELSRHQKLYSWMLKQPGVSAVVVGVRSVLHVREMIAVGAAATS